MEPNVDTVSVNELQAAMALFLECNDDLRSVDCSLAGARDRLDALVDRRFQAAVAIRDLGSIMVDDCVGHARSNGFTWKQVGESLGTSPQAAQQRYGRVSE